LLVAVIVFWQESKPVTPKKIAEIRKPAFLEIPISNTYSDTKDFLSRRHSGDSHMSQFVLEWDSDYVFPWCIRVKGKCCGLEILCGGSEIIKRGWKQFSPSFIYAIISSGHSRVTQSYLYPWTIGLKNILHSVNSYSGYFGTLRFHQYIGIQQSGIGSLFCCFRLLNQESKSEYTDNNSSNSCAEIPAIQAVRIGVILLLFTAGIWFLFWFFPNRECSNGWFYFGVIAIGVCWYFGVLVIAERWFGSPDFGPMDKWKHCKQGHADDNQTHFHGNNVPQKHLTSNNIWGTVIDMANVLNTDKQIAVIGALAEGSSIRSIERITGVHRDTIMRLGVKVGKGCAALLDAKMRDLPCKYLEFDEIWGFIGKKEKHVTVDDSPELGDVWTFCAVDAETKIVPTFRCGKRDRATANAFVQDVASRMKNRVQISTDGLRSYVEAIEKSFGSEVDFAQIVKTYTHDVEIQPNRRYSAPEIVSTEKKIFTGSPEIDRISTSYVERLNGTTRTHMRRLTRLTLAFSKKLENFEAAVGLHFAYYNFVKRHNTLRCTPAMAAGVESGFLSVADLVEASA
jgi:IS1 family transposase